MCVALAPSNTFAAVAVATPIKIQAAAALAEVANGIEVRVSNLRLMKPVIYH